jgi:hypothetical protein
LCYSLLFLLVIAYNLIYVVCYLKCNFTIKQTEFVEALKPQYTPGSTVTSNVLSTTPTQRLSSSMVDAAEIQNLKDQVQDYSEKLDVVKSKTKILFVQLFLKS